MRVIIIALLLAVLAFATDAQMTATIPVTKDAQVTRISRACPENSCPNVGSSPTIVVGNTEIDSIGLFGFNLASYIPQGASITSARLQLPDGSSPTGFNPIQVNVFLVEDDTWGEYTVVWQNRPGYSTQVGTTTFTAPNAPAPVDVTSQVQSAFSSDKQVGFAVTAQPPYNIFFTSREAQSGTPASLIVEYTTGSATCGGVTCSGTDQCCSGVCYNVNTHSCTASGVLCPAGFESCGSACYSPSLYVCYGTDLCPVGHLRCGAACYRPNVYQCCNGNRLAPAGSSC